MSQMLGRDSLIGKLAELLIEAGLNRFRNQGDCKIFRHDLGGRVVIHVEAIESLPEDQAVEYTCKASPSNKNWTFRLTDETLDLLDQERVVKRQVGYSEIKHFHQYAGFAVRDPESGPYDSEYCRVMPNRGKSVYLRNGTYVRPAGKIGEIVVNQNEDYVVFLSELKRRVCDLNPNVIVIRGWLLAMLAGWGVGLVGIAFIAFAIGGFVMDKFLTALYIAAFCLPVASVLLMMAYAYTKTYWPERKTLAEDLAPRPPIADASFEIRA